MSESRETTDVGAECMQCPSTQMVLTHEEEFILGRMRAVKVQLRAIAERLKELQVLKRQSPQAQAEWKDLSTRLEGLRAQWKEWQKKLEEAVEQKLIVLGHHNP